MQWPIVFDDEDFWLFKKEWKLSGGRADSFYAGAPYDGEECWVFYRKREPLACNIYYMRSAGAWRRVDWSLRDGQQKWAPKYVEA